MISVLPIKFKTYILIEAKFLLSAHNQQVVEQCGEFAFTNQTFQRGVLISNRSAIDFDLSRAFSPLVTSLFGFITHSVLATYCLAIYNGHFL